MCAVLLFYIHSKNMYAYRGFSYNFSYLRKWRNCKLGKTYAYIRVSSKDQNEARQIDAMRDFGVEERYMIIDKQSGKDFERPGYRKLMKKLKPEDTLVIKSIDRLGRNYEELQRQKQEEYSSEESQWNSRRNLQNCVNCG